MRVKSLDLLNQLVFADDREAAAELLSDALALEGIQNFTCYVVTRSPAGQSMEILLSQGNVAPAMGAYAREKLVIGDPISRHFDSEDVTDLAPYFDDPRPRPGGELLPRIVELMRDHGIHSGALVPLSRRHLHQRAFVSIGDEERAAVEDRGSTILASNPVVFAVMREFTARALADSPPAQSTLSLTSSERIVMRELIRGRTPAEIAQLTGKSVRTIRHQIESARHRLGAKTSLQAAALSLKYGLIDD